jgi:hypothetical protein
VGLEVVVGFLVAWAVAKARRVAQRADGVVDTALDAGVDRVRDMITTKLAGDSALERLQIEAAESGEVSERTRTRVALALADAADRDPEFAERLQAAMKQAAVGATGTVVKDVSQSVSGTVSGSNVQVGGSVGGGIQLHGPDVPTR